MTIKNGDFITLSYTGAVKDGAVFDTTDEDVAKKHNLVRENTIFAPIIICVGQGHLLAALDADIVGKDMNKEYRLEIKPEQAFGRREPSRLFKKEWFVKQKVNPMPGLEVTIGDDRGIIRSVSGGRVYVDMNHPLAGQDIVYTYTILNKVEDIKEQVGAVVKLRLGFEPQSIDVAENKATLGIAFELPEQLQSFVAEEITKTTAITDVAFTKVGDDQANKKV